MTARFWRRSFRWGVVIICDSDGHVDVPDVRGSQIVATSTMILVPLHHAQDVDFTDMGVAPDDVVPHAEVDIRCFEDVGVEKTVAPEFTGPVLCPSGKRTLGDADSVEAFDVSRGTVPLAILREPTEHADVVSVWIYS